MRAEPPSFILKSFIKDNNANPIEKEQLMKLSKKMPLTNCGSQNVAGPPFASRLT